MNASTSDASTSTDDISTGLPLLLYYFAHPLCVLSSSPPAVLRPPPAPQPSPRPEDTMQRRVPQRVYTRVLPPLELPTPRHFDSADGPDVWSRWAVPTERSLPPLSLPPPAALPSPPAPSLRRSPRVAPLAGVRKSVTRARGSLARLLRRAVVTDGVSRCVAAPRLAWQPSPLAPRSPLSTPSPCDECLNTRLGLNPRTCSSGGTATYRAGSARAVPACDMGPSPPPLLRRRYSLPETVMRRYRLTREQSETEEFSMPSSGGMGGIGNCGGVAARDLVRRSALLRRLYGPSGAPLSSTCRCDTRSLNGSLADVWSSRSPTRPTPRLVEVSVSQTSTFTPPKLIKPKPKPIDSNIDIDQYVSNILVDSLNSLSDRLENMTVSIGEGVSVVEKEIKVKLQSKGVNTVVHLSPTSNNQIIFGNKELCEKDPLEIEKSILSRQVEVQESEEDGWNRPGAVSPTASLVDSLDDPLSPRVLPSQPSQPPQLPQPIQTQLLQPPTPPRPPTPPISTSPQQNSDSMTHKEKCESFFIRMNEDNCACEKENIVVADHMPEKIKQRLHRRHRRRELRARRGGVRRAARDVQRQCSVILDAFIDDAITRIARDELRCARIARKIPPPVSEEPPSLVTRIRSEAKPKVDSSASRKKPELPNVKRASPTRQKQLATRDKNPRRLYHKSEIHDGGKCIEILEIVEYAQTSRSSSETNSDESNGARVRKSRIPVPVEKHDGVRVRRTGSSVTQSTVVPGKTELNLSRTSSVSQSTVPVTTERSLSGYQSAVVPVKTELNSSRTVAPVSQSTVVPVTTERNLSRTVTSISQSSVGPVTTERSLSGSVRFERVFDVIPEEKSSLSVESADEQPPTASLPAPSLGVESADDKLPSPSARISRRSAATSPPPPLQPQRGERRSVGTQWMRSVARGDSSSEGQEPRPRIARRPVRHRPSLRVIPAPAPVKAPINAATETATQSASAPRAKAAADSEGWSLTLAGSCRAALPTRLDLRLRFPRGNSAARGAGEGVEVSPRSDAHTDCCSDSKSQDTEWTRAQLTDRARPARERLPALRPSQAQGGCGRCRCGSPGTAGGAGGAGRVPSPNTRRRRRDAYHAAELKALSVWGSAIVPSRRAPPPVRRPSLAPHMRTRSFSYSSYM